MSQSSIVRVGPHARRELSLRQGFNQRQEQQVGLRVDPKIVLSSSILQMSRQELDQAIENELNENPALERLDDEQEPISEEAVLKSVAPQELQPGSEDAEFRRSLPNDESGVDWVDLTSTHISLSEHLTAQMVLRLPAEHRRLAEFVAGCVNEKGYLTLPAEEIALATGFTLEEAEFAIRVLKQCEPSGVGAVDIKECLLLQLRDNDEYETKLARAILKFHMDELVARRTRKIARKYGVLPDVVDAAFDLILSLNPFPGEGFLVNESSRQNNRAASIIPDLLLRRSEYGWEVQVNGADPTLLTISRSYRRRMNELRVGTQANRDELKHVTQHVDRATHFIQSLIQRRQTLRKIGEYLVEHQGGFVTTGRYEFLGSLTRTQLARAIGMHESTVSRATMGKFVEIANGEVVSFEIFFKPALRVQKMIEQILESENPGRPLSDQEIAAMLAERGIHVARRTVNKYRDRGKLLSSRIRRSA